MSSVLEQYKALFPDVTAFCVCFKGYNLHRFFPVAHRSLLPRFCSVPPVSLSPSSVLFLRSLVLVLVLVVVNETSMATTSEQSLCRTRRH